VDWIWSGIDAAAQVLNGGSGPAVHRARTVVEPVAAGRNVEQQGAFSQEAKAIREMERLPIRGMLKRRQNATMNGFGQSSIW
jgi:hypothetical protein